MAAPTVRVLRTVPEFEDATRLLCQVWHAENALDLINSSVLVALSMCDNYVAGIFLGSEMVGAAVGWRGKTGRIDHLHSHIVGIHPEHQGAGLGYELKLHERRWALQRGITAIQWTFDPLVRRNAHFNLSKLGARVLSYHENLYGSLHDGVNDDDQTDRLLVEWDLLVVPAPAAEANGSDLVGPAWRDARSWDFRTRPDATITAADGSVRLIATPPDEDRLRHDNPGVAALWREAVRKGMASARAAGLEVTAFTADGYYVLAPQRTLRT